MWSDDRDPVPGVNDDALLMATPSIDDDVPHFQPPNDHNDGGHPHPQLSPTMTSPGHNMSTPACQQYFFHLSIFYHLLFPYLSTARQLSPASPSDLNANPNDYEENDSPKQEDVVLLLVSVCVITSHHPSSITTCLITCSLLFIN